MCVCVWFVYACASVCGIMFWFTAGVVLTEILVYINNVHIFKVYTITILEVPVFILTYSNFNILMK